ncbi:MAG: pyridoxal phosphate-dependent aminotransferase [Candidatus Zixiibacteriota bacterium]
MPIKKIVIDRADRIFQLPPDVTSFVTTEPRRTLGRSIETIDLASFSWQSFTEADVSRSMGVEEATPDALTELKEAIADWFLSVHRVRVDPKKEILVGGSISSLIYSLTLAFVDSGDLVFHPDLGIPLYRKVTAACGGQPVGYRVSAKTDWLPDLGRVHTRLGRVSRVLILNSPHNPTGSCLSEREMAELVHTASRENIVLVNDAAYQSIPSRMPVSLLGVPGGRKVGVEVYSMSYLLGLPQYPMGFVAGHRDMIAGIKASFRLVKPYLPAHFVSMALNAIRQYPSQDLEEVRRRLNESAIEATRLLKLLDLQKTGYDGVPFVWARIERRRRSAAIAQLLYRRSRIAVVPGTAFGENGEGYIRFSLTAPAEAYRSACERVKRKLKLFRSTGEQ